VTFCLNSSSFATFASTRLTLTFLPSACIAASKPGMMSFIALMRRSWCSRTVSSTAADAEVVAAVVPALASVVCDALGDVPLEQA
jgi:hypothetical protein